MVVVIKPVWDWVVAKWLDKIFDEKSDILTKIQQTVDGTLSIMAPFQQILIGMFAGMMLALLIGYWGAVWTTIVNALKTIRLALFCAYAVIRPKHKLIIGGVRFLEGEKHKDVRLGQPIKEWKSEVRWWPEHEFVCTLSKDTLHVRKATPTSTATNVNFEVWGKADVRTILRRRRQQKKNDIEPENAAAEQNDLESDEFILLHEAATRAYEETEDTRVAGFAEMPLPSGKRGILSWYAYALIGKKHDTPIFGKKPPSRIRRQISVQELRQCRLSENAQLLMRPGEDEPAFLDLEIKTSDFEKRLAEIQSWSGE